MKIAVGFAGRVSRCLYCFLLLGWLTACAVTPPPAPLSGHDAVYQVAAAPDADLIRRFAPVFVCEEAQLPHNRIGTPQARIRGGNQERIEILVDPGTPTLYYQVQTFRTARASYTNLIYRIHFEKVPFSLFPFHLSAGKNVGLLVIVTLNSGEKPVLFTVVHTCGCYLAFIPTSFLPAQAFPEGWNFSGRRVWGAQLPGRLEYDASSPEPTNTVDTVFVLKSGTHRLKEIRLIKSAELKEAGNVIRPALKPMQDLEKLPYNGKAVSFFEEKGRRRGYVKNSHKPFERLLMSWWVMDWRVGEDKILGPADVVGVRFYTSLKFWRRKESDMWEFAEFLRYWGWNL